MKSIGYSAFLNCGSLTSVTIGGSVTSIGDNAFNNTNLTSVIIPNNVISIGKSAFQDNGNLASVTIGNGVTSIGESAFANCIKLKSATIGESVKFIGETAFSACSSLTSITIPNSVTEIGDGMFYECRRLTSVTIGNGVTSIGKKTFYGCNGLIAVTIGSSVTSIGYGAFDGGYGTGYMKNLKVITMLNPNPPKVAVTDNKGVSSLERVDKATCILYVPEGSLYNMANVWKDFKNIRYGAPTTQEINEIIKKDEAEKKKNEAEKKAGEYARTREGVLNIINKNIDIAELNNAYNELLKKRRGAYGQLGASFTISPDGRCSRVGTGHSVDKFSGMTWGMVDDFQRKIGNIAQKWNFNFGKGACTTDVDFVLNFAISDSKSNSGKVSISILDISERNMCE